MTLQHDRSPLQPRVRVLAGDGRHSALDDGDGADGVSVSVCVGIRAGS